MSKIRIQARALLAPTLLICAQPSFAADTGNTAWMLTATALVLFMTIPGLSLFYAGLVRAKNVLSVLMQCFAITGLMSLLWFVAGYSIAFGSDGVEPGAYIGDMGNMFLVYKKPFLLLEGDS